MKLGLSSFAVVRVGPVLGVLVSTALAVLLVPRIIPLGAVYNDWQAGLVTSALLFAMGVTLWANRLIQPVVDVPSDDPQRRQLAHDFPFRLTRIFVVGATGAGLLTVLLTWSLGLSGAVVAGVITYVLLMLPVVGIYLYARRALRSHVAGPPGSSRVHGIRQPIAVRLTFAVQIPIVVCCVGIVVIAQSNARDYGKALEDYHRESYTILFERTLRALPTDADRSALLKMVNLPKGLLVDSTGQPTYVPVGEAYTLPMGERLPPYILLAMIILLSAALGPVLARELTTDLSHVRGVLEGLKARGVPRVESNQVVAFQETAEVVNALDRTLRGFATRQDALAQAAADRRAAEHAKSRFLAHLSHELKSPLNSILGFSEVLLTELDGPLTERQAERTSIIWRSGESLLRFILVLLDSARYEAPESLTSPPRAQSIHDVDSVVAAINAQMRPDPCQKLIQTIQLSADGDLTVRDPEHLARAILLAAGLLFDALDGGEVSISLTTDGADLVLQARVVSADGDDVDRAALIRSIERASEPDALGRVSVTLALLEHIVGQQSGSFKVEIDQWPVFILRVPVNA